MSFPAGAKVWITTLLAYGLAQVIIALGGFLRIPLLVDNVGVSAYGVIVAASGLCVIVIAIADGFTQVARIQAIDVGFGAYPVLQRQANSLALIVLTLSGCALVVAWLCMWEWASTTAAAFVGAAFSIFGGTSRGFIEARGRTALSNLLQTTTTLVGVPFLAVVLFGNGSIQLVGFVTGLGLACPQLFSWLALRGREKKVRTGEGAAGLGLFASFREIWLGEPARSIRRMVQWTWANAASYAFDAAIVAVIVGSVGAAEYGLASRIMTLAMFLTLGLNPLITSQVGRWRSIAPNVLFKKSLKLSLVLVVGATALSALTIWIASPLAAFLSQGKIRLDVNLLVWLAAFAILSAGTAPLMALYAGRGGAGFRRTASLIGAGMNLFVSFLASHLFGVVGPAVGSVIGLLTLTLILIVGLPFRRQAVLQKYEK